MTSLVYFIRHGQTAWNAEGRLQGQSDTDITEIGRGQADRNGRRLAGLIEDPSAFDYVASPMRRTRETMERVRLALGLPAAGYRTDDRLVELSFGDWQGFTFAELEVNDPGASKRRSRNKWAFVPPGEGAESYAMLLERVRPVLDSFEKPTVCVTHGGVLRAVFRHFGKMSEKEAASLDVLQDRVLRLKDGRLDWM